MRVPHVINRNTKYEFDASKETLELLGEEGRKLLSENFEWDAKLCPTLVTICVRAICKNFKENPLLELPCPDKNHLLEILPTDVPLELVVPLIEEEVYWERRYSDQFGMVTRGRHPGWTWKCLYLETHMQQVVEQAQPQYGDEENMEELTTLIGPFIHRLRVTELQAWKPPLTWPKEEYPEVYPIDHVNFEPIMKNLTEIEELDIIYGLSGVSDTFNWQMFNISVDDCRNLGRAILKLKYIKRLRLHRSLLEDQHIQKLIQGLVKNKTLIELDLSHCKIGDRGALCIAKLIMVHTKLEVLSLCDNRIREEGAIGLGFAILKETCCPLRHLNLRLNPLEHEGTMAILRALVRGNKPEELNLAGVGFTEETALRTGLMLKLNSTLKVLDFSNNWFGEEGGQALVEGMAVNKTVQLLDIRETDILEKDVIKINKYLRRNQAGESDDESSSSSEEEDAAAAADEEAEEHKEESGLANEAKQPDAPGDVEDNASAKVHE